MKVLKNKIVSLLTWVVLSSLFFSASDKESEGLKDYSIENPVKYKNIEIFMISGNYKANNVQYITLQNALKDSMLLVHETGHVNQLQISNQSKETVYILAGEIVKGGRQDRTFANDMIIPPNVLNIPIESFCVESGRWRQRGEEEANKFSSSYNMLSSADLKVAAKYKKNQYEVWSEVAEQQDKLKGSISNMVQDEVEVVNNESPSSLQLTLENEDLNKIKEEYKLPFFTLLSKYKKSIGYAYAINGEVKGIELFNNKKLFTDLWNKLLDAMIVEAISEADSIFEFRTNKEAIFEFAEKCEKEENETDSINSITLLKTFGDKENVLFISTDLNINNWIHKSYLKVDTTNYKGSGERGIQRNYEQRLIDDNLQQQIQLLQE